MPALLTHIFIPLFILLAFSDQLKLSKKMIVVMSFFGIFPDLDMFTLHRAVLHNIFILIIPLLFYVFWKDIKLSGIMAFYMFSHILLDMFNQGVYIFYPFWQKVVYFMVGIGFDNFTIFPIYKLIIEDSLSVKFIDSPMISSENTATVILILIMFIVTMIVKHKSINSNKQI